MLRCTIFVKFLFSAWLWFSRRERPYGHPPSQSQCTLDTPTMDHEGMASITQWGGAGRRR